MHDIPAPEDNGEEDDALVRDAGEQREEGEVAGPASGSGGGTSARISLLIRPVFQGKAEAFPMIYLEPSGGMQWIFVKADESAR